MQKSGLSKKVYELEMADGRVEDKPLFRWLGSAKKVCNAMLMLRWEELKDFQKCECDIDNLFTTEHVFETQQWRNEVDVVVNAAGESLKGDHL